MGRSISWPPQFCASILCNKFATGTEMAAHLGTCLYKGRVAMGKRNVAVVHHVNFLFSDKLDKRENVLKVPAGHFYC